ncbi:MAG: hypothetical protein E7248_20610 [Paenibacillaceae bacterium]|nr:hypothetical protein [Paenibacillaceae bacterium]
MCGCNNIVVNCGCCGKGNGTGGINGKLGRCMLMPSESNAKAGLGTIVPFSEVVECDGLTYSATDGTIHLLKDHTYRMEAFVRFVGSKGNEIWQIYNKTAETFVKGSAGHYGRNLEIYSGACAAQTIYTPSSDCDVCIKITASFDEAEKETTALKTINPTNSYFTVIEI